MSSVTEVVDKLKARARPDQLGGMARYGISVDRRLGVSIPELRKLARELGRDHRLALGLWRTGIADARILASMVDDPARLTEAQMEAWVKDFDSWDVCDQVCDNLFEKAPFVWKKIADWSEREEEFVKRAAFALMACLAWHDKKAGDDRFTEIFPLIVRGATDERNYVKKAVNWALRNIGKRNPRLNRESIAVAREIQRLDSRAARWIAADAIRELEGQAVQARLKRGGS
ncbi:MAG: DNA alkylation repair protein [Chloroflexi bacterium]|nr:DNA alkylation repair protein [Chloroflexota bacterium]